MDSKRFYTIPTINTSESSWQPDAIINSKIQSDAGIISNWKYRQYAQNNAKHIMKYNSIFSYSNKNIFTVIKFKIC